jgi:hypothetical protein
MSITKGEVSVQMCNGSQVLLQLSKTLTGLPPLGYTKLAVEVINCYWPDKLLESILSTSVLHILTNVFLVCYQHLC